MPRRSAAILSAALTLLADARLDGFLLGVDLGLPILTIGFARRHDPDAAWHAVRAGTDVLLTPPRAPAAGSRP